MTTINRILERNQMANLLALQCMLRISGLLGIGILSSVRKNLDTYLLCLQHSTDYVRQSRIGDSPDQLVAGYADAMTECVDKSWQDFRNNLQILLLTQDEALIWVARIDKALLEG
ncbi:hypothetical protein [Candidatus Contendibacter odensensis]|uniref:Uncharacterized protein n=1 Tax=Candidatus Contendobacter odensis Run_B_J11 TaxID=1400861 RepID=A0A7U7GF37_9GAMM|nr:hypothetical protein [Candidatus Contendobacter odensis]MBK8752506.1 hypothetical protein [Candidatus Competibacteraceae bacterium]CDH47008.1 hypothetical protein BN874_690058 [Candidatus Contendobacter odensis Run_B_J11]